MPNRQSLAFLQNNNNSSNTSENYTLQFLSLPFPLIEELVLHLIDEYVVTAVERERLSGGRGTGEGKNLKTRFHAKVLPSAVEGSSALGEYLHRSVVTTSLFALRDELREKRN